MKFCQTCGRQAGEDDIVCSFCKGNLGSTPINQNRVTDQELDKLTSQVWKRTWKKHVGLIFGEFCILTIIGVVEFNRMSNEALEHAQKVVTDRVVAEFQTDRIRQTVSNVASNQASQLLVSQIRPEVTRFGLILTNELNSLRNASLQETTNITLLVSNSLSVVYSNIFSATNRLATINQQILAAQKNLEELKAGGDFVLTLLNANNDDRMAYDQLGAIGSDTNSPFFRIARKAYENLQTAPSSKFAFITKAPVWTDPGMSLG